MENLGIDIKLLIAQLVNFVLFFIIFKKFIAKPFVAFLTKQKKEDEERTALLEKSKKMEDELVEKETAWKKKASAEAEETLKAAKVDAVAVREDIIKEAQAEAEKIIAKAKKQIDEEREELQKEVKNSVADLSTLLVSNAMKEYLTEKEQKQLTERILKNLNKGLPVYEN